MNQDVPDGAEVTEKMREQGRALLTRLHKAAGHPSNRALARICRDRGMPKWMMDLALNLHCQACLHTKRGGTMVVPHSVGTKPQPWQMLGMDVFELIFPQQRRKARYLLAICLVMRLVMVEILWEGPMNESGTDSGQKLVDTFAASWLQHRPKPEWLLTDPQSSLAKGDFAEFCGWIGCGLATTPGEAHWQNGAVEMAVKAVKKTMKRLRNESTELSATLCGHLAASAHNQMEVVKGFSPIQWAFGSRQDADPLEVNKHRGERPESFWQQQRWRARVEEIHKQELPRETFTRLIAQCVAATGGGLPAWRLGMRLEERYPQSCDSGGALYRTWKGRHVGAARVTRRTRVGHLGSHGHHPMATRAGTASNGQRASRW